MFDALFSGFLDDDFDQAVEIHAGEVIEANALEHGAAVKSEIASAFHDDAFAGLVDDGEMPVEGGQRLFHRRLDLGPALLDLFLRELGLGAAFGDVPDLWKPLVEIAAGRLGLASMLTAARRHGRAGLDIFRCSGARFEPGEPLGAGSGAGDAKATP